MKHVVFAALWATACGSIEEFTVYTEPITMKPGQVHNHPVKPIPLPAWVVKKYASKPMGVVKFQLDIVRNPGADDEAHVPESEIYNHHTIQAMGTNDMTNGLYKAWQKADPLGPPPQHGSLHTSHHNPHCGSKVASLFLEGDNFVSKLEKDGKNIWVGPVGGAEYLDADRDLPAPYRQAVDSPQSMVAILHFINIKNGPYTSKDWPRLFECPCTSARKIDPANGTIDGNKPLPFNCTADLLLQKNEDCKLETYKGGYRCCEHLDFVTESTKIAEPAQTVYGKFTFRIDDLTPETQMVQQGAFDVTGHNAEYSIPACIPSEGTVPRNECVHVATNRELIADALGATQYMHLCPNGYIELITARGHQHVGALGMEMYDDSTGQLLCASHPVKKDGFIVGIPPCVWGPPPFRPPPKLKWTDRITIISRYNSTEEHHGVMGFWFFQAFVSCGNSNNNTAVLV